MRRFDLPDDDDYTVAAWLDAVPGGPEQWAHELAGYDPERVQAIYRSCTLTEIAAAWRHKKASEYGWGWKRKDKPLR